MIFAQVRGDLKALLREIGGFEVVGLRVAAEGGARRDGDGRSEGGAACRMRCNPMLPVAPTP